MINKQLIIILCLSFIIIPFIGASESSLGIFKQGECINLLQTCSNCTYNNISSVVYPNSTEALGESVMSKVGVVYNKSFCDTGVLGTYVVNGYGDPNNLNTIWSYSFEVAPAYKITTGISLFYIGIIVLLCFLFIICIVGMNSLPDQDPRDNEGKLMSINNLKYFRYILGALAWGILVIISFVIFNFAEGYISEGLLLAVFRMMFTFLMISAMIGIPIIFWFMVSRFMQDVVIKRMIERNIFTD